MRHTRRLKFQPGVEFGGNAETAKRDKQEALIKLYSKIYNFGGEGERD